MIYRATGSIHCGSSVESGFDPGTLRPRDLTTKPPRLYHSLGIIVVKFLIMGRYQRKTDRQSWFQDSMAGAIQEVLEGNMGYRRASKAYSVPQTTLERKVKEARQKKLSSEAAAGKMLGR
ncbi:hypothetical protein AVEN_142367-1 [Araneus ventricosus]|uniref:HTH psq-type domain-containing protein n=1 Tax=Araneus ventricosus TaxID=182803 RepID=A0A4Y2SDE5_ARAVE|nr:hypothetical protein AVEN_142367-1 [Araneus ventricosus]